MIKLQAPKKIKDIVLNQKKGVKTLVTLFVQNFNKAVQVGSLSPAAKKTISKYLVAKENGKGIEITFSDPRIKFILGGQKRKLMDWLKPLKAVPITTAEGKLIFRTPSKASIQEGGWVFPGRKKQNVFEEASKQLKTPSNLKLLRKALLKK